MPAKFKLSDLADDLALLAEYEKPSEQEIELRRKLAEARASRDAILDASKQCEKDAAEQIKKIQNLLWAKLAEAQAKTGKLNQDIRAMEATLEAMPPKTDAIQQAQQLMSRYGMTLAELKALI